MISRAIIELTPSISKLAEDFIVSSHFGPAVLAVIDPNPFGAIPKSSTTQALTPMLHQWLEATDAVSYTHLTLPTKLEV